MGRGRRGAAGAGPARWLALALALALAAVQAVHADYNCDLKGKACKKSSDCWWGGKRGGG